MSNMINRYSVGIILEHKLTERDKEKCRNCNEKGEVFHHIFPKGRGGKDEVDNLITLCNKCHRMVHQGNHMTIGFWVRHFKLMIKEINAKTPKLKEIKISDEEYEKMTEELCGKLID